MMTQIGHTTVGGTPEEINEIQTEIEFGHWHEDTPCQDCSIACNGDGMCPKIVELEASDDE